MTAVCRHHVDTYIPWFQGQDKNTFFNMGPPLFSLYAIISIIHTKSPTVFEHKCTLLVLSHNSWNSLSRTRSSVGALKHWSLKHDTTYVCTELAKQYDFYVNTKKEVERQIIILLWKSFNRKKSSKSWIQIAIATHFCSNTIIAGRHGFIFCIAVW